MMSALARIAAMDMLKQNVNGQNGEERFDSESALMAGELNQLFDALVSVLGVLSKAAK